MFRFAYKNADQVMNRNRILFVLPLFLPEKLRMGEVISQETTTSLIIAI